MFGFVKSEKYSLAFSFIVGVGIMAVLKPGCREKDCTAKRGANPEEVTSATYQIGNKCYQFKVRDTECPSEGVVEAFRASM
jgi:hypothetical protein